MRTWMMLLGLAMVAAAPLSAEERGYITGVGGFAVTPDTTSGDVRVEGGARVARHLMVFGDIGRYHDVQPSDALPTVDSTAAVSASQGLSVLGTARVPAWYSIGGVRYEMPATGRVSPYVLGGVGVARLTPTVSFTYSSGALPDGTTLTTGADVTQQLVTDGTFTAPPASSAFMFTLGGGVAIPVAGRWGVDIGYRFSRITADNPFNAQGATFGFGYHF